MLVIRQAQMDALQETLVGGYARRMVPRLRRSCPGLLDGLETGEAEARVRTAVRKAVGWRVADPLALEAFVELTLRLGPGFDHRDEVRAKLAAAPDIGALELRRAFRSGALAGDAAGPPGPEER